AASSNNDAKTGEKVADKQGRKRTRPRQEQPQNQPLLRSNPKSANNQDTINTHPFEVIVVCCVPDVDAPVGSSNGKSPARRVKGQCLNGRRNMLYEPTSVNKCCAARHDPLDLDAEVGERKWSSSGCQVLS